MDTSLIFDVGMNNGDDTAYYLHRGFRVVAVEADPTLANAARCKFSDAIAAKRLDVVNIAIGPRHEVAPFYLCQTNNVWNSFRKDVASRDGNEPQIIDVPCVPFQSLLAQYGVPLYLKVDIEGHDHFCLTALDRADLPRYVSFEASDDEESRASLRHLKGLGYRRFKFITQNDFSALARRPTLKSRLRNHRIGRGIRRRLPIWQFPFGSSGPFGEQTDGAWLSYDELLTTLRWFGEGRSPLGPPGAPHWHDVHARL
jgi:FkbM family methyltransferase